LSGELGDKEMKAVILPTSNINFNKSFSTTNPEFLIPVVNKPIVEHLVELLEQHGVKEILMAVRDKVEETKNYFGSGERWGVKIKYYDVSLNEKSVSIFKQNKEFLDQPFLCVPSNCITNLNIGHFVDSYKNSSGGMEISHTYKADSTLDYIPTYSDISYREKSIFILDPVTIGFLNPDTDNDLKHMSEKCIQNHIHVNIFRSPHEYHVVENIEDLWTIEQKIIREGVDGIAIPGEERERGVWIGQSVSLHPTVKIEPPILIGNFSKIGEGVRLKKGAVVGENVVIDKNASVDSASIWNDTYAGAYTEIKNCVISKDVLFSVSNHTTIQISDPFILGANSVENIFGFKYWLSKYLNPLRVLNQILSFLCRIGKLRRALSHAMALF
jgi:mannose-1-phosphate guanylyltransferase/phosphomannomutase